MLGRIVYLISYLRKKKKKERKKTDDRGDFDPSAEWTKVLGICMHRGNFFISSNKFKRVRLIEAKSEKRCRYEMSGTELSIFVRRKTNPLRNAVIISTVTIERYNV